MVLLFSCLINMLELVIFLLLSQYFPLKLENVFVLY